MSDVMDHLRALDPERDGSSGAPPLGWLRALLDAEAERPRHRRHAQRAPGPHRRRPIAVAVALICLAALALVAVAVLGGSAPAPRRDALVPANGDGPVIVHVTLRRGNADDPRSGAVTMNGPGRTKIGRVVGPAERWSTADPLRWREFVPVQGGRGMRGGTMDAAFDRGVVRSRDSWRREVSRVRVPGLLARSYGSAFGLLAGLSPLAHSEAGRALVAGVADPRAFVEEMVARGDLHADGTTRRGDRTLLRFNGQSEQRETRAGGFVPATRTIYLLDPVTYAPVELRTAWSLGARNARSPPRFANWTTLLVETYETIPLTRATAPLLRLGGPVR